MLKPLPKGSIVTGKWGGVVPMSGLLHPDCLWLLTSRGVKSEFSIVGYVQDTRCLRHGSCLYDVDGEFLRDEVDIEQILSLVSAIEQDLKSIEKNTRVLTRKLNILSQK